MASLILPPLSLYVHLPWCREKCPYCDFNSHAANTFPAARYVDALLADLERELPRVWGRPVSSVFFGGGTPSLFPAGAIDALLSGIRARLRLVPGAEITLEANPGAVEAGAFQGFRDAGITRLSLGVQSFQDRFLQRLGRIHDGQEARMAIESLVHAGFQNWNVDLIFALPGQRADEALEDVREALSYAPPHVSLYQLTLEPGTPFGSHPPAGLPDADRAAEMEEMLRSTLDEGGLERYEISAHARPGQACWHNRNYWKYGDYLGIGAGAHGKLTMPGQGIWRSRRTPRPETYMDSALDTGGSPGDGHWVLPEDRPFEFFLNVLRLVEGFGAELFELRTGLPFVEVEGRLRQAEKQGLLQREDGVWRPTPMGLNWHNELCLRFLPENSGKWQGTGNVRTF